jgi:hypothetical protein
MQRRKRVPVIQMIPQQCRLLPPEPWSSCKRSHSGRESRQLRDQVAPGTPGCRPLTISPVVRGIRIRKRARPRDDGSSDPPACAKKDGPGQRFPNGGSGYKTRKKRREAFQPAARSPRRSLREHPPETTGFRWRTIPPPGLPWTPRPLRRPVAPRKQGPQPAANDRVRCASRTILRGRCCVGARSATCLSRTRM